jgi:hypothetical protein
VDDPARAACPTGASSGVNSEYPRPKVLWWPSALKGNLDAKGIRHQRFDLYTIERPGNSVQNFILLFAVDWSKSRAFFYSRYK